MDSISAYLLVALAASLTASVSGLALVRPRAKSASAGIPQTDEPATAVQTKRMVSQNPPSAPVAEEPVVAPPPPPKPASMPQPPVPPSELLQPPATEVLKFTPVKIARIIVQKGSEPKEWRMDGDRVIIGRAPEAECFIPSLTVSRKHALIERKGAQFVLTDYGSRNGTYVRGVRITDPVVLRSHDTLEMGEIVLEFVLD